MKSYHIITIGCQMNKSDSERLAGRLEKMGYKRSDNKYQADLVVVNTCGVRQSAEDRPYGLIPEIKKANPKCFVLVTGCLVYRQDVKKRLGDYVDEWLSISQISNFPPKADQPLADKFLRPDPRICWAKAVEISNKCPNPNDQNESHNYLKIQPIYTSKFSAFVPIGNGCNNFCSYCVVPDARGKEVYRSAKDILDEARGLVKRGYKEIILIAQNVNSYKSGKTDFADLLKTVNNIKGDFWIRFITSHPKDMSDKLIKTIARCPKVCQHIHLPAQAGDDVVLKRMNRRYTCSEYMKLVRKIRKVLNYELRQPKVSCQRQTRGRPLAEITNYESWQPPVAITTDIIVGFPGETKKQFNNTVKLFRQVKFDMAYIAKYSLRPGTAAAKLDDDVPQQEKKRREEELMKILRRTALENNKKYVGKTAEILVDGKSKTGEWVGKTRTSKNVKFPISNVKNNLLGKFVKVKIIKARDFGMDGEIIN